MDKPYIKKIQTLEEQRKIFADFSNFYEKAVSQNKSGVIKIIHPKEYNPVKNGKNGFSETDIRKLNMKIGRPDTNKFRKLSDGIWHGNFGKYEKKSMKISEIFDLSKTEEYKAPATDLKNKERIYWKKWSNAPVYASNIDLSLMNSDDFHFGNLDTMLKYVQKWD